MFIYYHMNFFLNLKSEQGRTWLWDSQPSLQNSQWNTQNNCSLSNTWQVWVAGKSKAYGHTHDLTNLNINTIYRYIVLYIYYIVYYIVSSQSFLEGNTGISQEKESRLIYTKLYGLGIDTLVSIFSCSVKSIQLVSSLISSCWNANKTRNY